MTDTKAAPAAERASTSAGPSDLHLVRESLTDLIRGKLAALFALVPLAVGAVLLSSGWTLYSQRGEFDELSRQLSVTDQGRLLEAWWELPSDGSEVSWQNWMASLEPRLCLRIAHGAQAVVSAHCRQWPGGLREPFHLLDRAAVDAIPLLVTDTGPIAIDLRWDAELLRQVEPMAAMRVHGRGAEDQTPLDDFYAWLDDPLLAVLSANRATQLDLRHDPDDLTRALPPAVLDEGSDAGSDVPLLMMLLIGIVFLAIGLHFLLLDTHRLVLPLALVGSVVAIPWWGEFVWKTFDSILPGAGKQVEDVAEAILYLPPRVEFVPADYSGQPDLVRRPWRLADSSYADVLADLDLRLDAPAADIDTLTRQLGDHIADQLLALDDAALAARLASATAVEVKRGTSANLLLLESARRLLASEPDREKPRIAAERLLEATIHPDRGFSPHRFAAHELIRQWQALAEVASPGLRSKIDAALASSRHAWREAGAEFPDRE